MDRIRGEIGRVVSAACEGGHSNAWALTGKVATWLASLARGEGLELEGYSHTIDASAVKHVLARHADPTVEMSRGQLPIAPEDMMRLPEILADPDKVAFGLRSVDGLSMIAFARRMSDGSTIVLQEVRTGRRRLALKSVRKVPAAANIESAPSTLQPDVRSVGGLRIKLVNLSANVKSPEPTGPGRANRAITDTSPAGPVRETGSASTEP